MVNSISLDHSYLHDFSTIIVKLIFFFSVYLISTTNQWVKIIMSTCAPVQNNFFSFYKSLSLLSLSLSLSLSHDIKFVA